MSNQIKNIYCWNANSINNKFEEIILALNENDIDILAINETKINKIDEYFYQNEKFNCIFNSRNRHGGGVAFIIRKEIDYYLIKDLEKFNSECLCIKIEINNEETYLITYYNSPNTDINIEMLEFIEIDDYQILNNKKLSNDQIKKLIIVRKNHGIEINQQALLDYNTNRPVYKEEYKNIQYV